MSQNSKKSSYLWDKKCIFNHSILHVSGHSAPAQEQQQQQPPPVEVNQEHVATLMDMGFTRERCIEALQAHSSLEQATDYLLNNPVPPQRSSSDSTSAAAASSAATGGGSEAPRVGSGGLPAAILATPGTGPASSSGAGNEQDDLMRAIAMSLGENPIGNDSSNESTNAVAPGGSSKPPTGLLIFCKRRIKKK